VSFSKNLTFAGMLLMSITSQAQMLSGEITNEKNEAVAGATIHLLNSGEGTISDVRGNYQLNNLSPGKYTVVVSAIGYAEENKEINLGQSGVTLNFKLNNSLVRLDAIVVTAQKKEELLQKVPVSITALSAKQVQEYRLWDSKDLTALVPNLFSNNSGDGRNVTSLRGIATTSYDPAVATYIDGVNQFSLDTYIPTLFDVDRIEVLRGPQGTLYGRNAMGGVINIITKKPGNEPHAFVEASVGNHNLQRYSAGFSAPLVKNKLFFGAAAMFDKRDGYYTNELTNSSFDKQNGITGNYYLKFIPAEKWDITLNVKHRNNKNDGAFPLVNGKEEAFSNPFNLSQDAVGKMHDNTMNASLNIHHAGHSVNFTSVSAWQQNHRYYDAPLDGDFSPADAVTIINDFGNKWNNVKVFTQEFRFSSPARNTKRLKYTAGTYFFYQDNPVKQATHYGKDATLLGASDTDFSTINTSKSNNTGIALYGQTTYSLFPKLDLIAGLRYDYENKKLDVIGEYQKDGQPSAVIQPDTAATANFSAFSPKLGFNYEVSGNTNVYITYNRGFRTGGLTQLSADPSHEPPLYPYKPEYSNNFEAGVKNTFLNNRLRFNATLFVTTITDAQVPTLILPQAITVTKNTGKLTSKGVEIEVAAAPAKGFEINYNFGYTDAKYTSLKVPQDGQVVDLNGNKQIYTPDITSMLAAQYTYAFGRKGSLKLIGRAEWKYIGTEYFDLANNISQSPYSLVNLKLGLSTKWVDVFFWSRNTGNQKFIAYAYDFGAIHLGDPATYGATVRFKL
jgi:iron complex outermembrane receptor protein